MIKIETMVYSRPTSGVESNHVVGTEVDTFRNINLTSSRPIRSLYRFHQNATFDHIGKNLRVQKAGQTLQP